MWDGCKPDLFVTLVAVIGIGPLQQVSLDVLLQRLQQVLVIADVNVQGGEGLLTGIPAASTSGIVKLLFQTAAN